MTPNQPNSGSSQPDPGEEQLKRLFEACVAHSPDPRLLPEAVDRIRREAEERSRAEQSSRDNEARLKAIVNTAVDGIITIDERGIIESANPAAERIFGFQAAEMIGQNVKLLMPNPYHDEHDQYMHNYLTTGRRKIIGIGREVLGKRKDGTIFPMDLAVSEVGLGDRRIFTGLVRDITARKQAEEELRRAKESAERSWKEAEAQRSVAEKQRELAEAANKAKDHFLAVLSHELRTPLTPVLAIVAYVESQMNLPEELRDEIGTIRRNVEMEARLIDDLLDLTRISRGKISLQCQVVDAHASLRSALEIAQSDIETKDLEVTTTLRAKQHHVQADPARLQQIFWNLIKNAVKFTPEGGRIVLRSTNTPEGKLRVEVADTGVGIEPEVLPRIFNAFEQGERTVTRQFGGLGLGLAITKALIDLHKGSIEAHSAGRNQGASFIVQLATTDPIRPVAAPAGNSQRSTAPPAVRHCRILLVEDHEDTLRIMATLLRRFGYDVKTATSVQRAVDLIDREKFDLLISDLGLPDGTGLDVMRHARSHGIRGIAVSGFGMDEDVRRSREAGFEQHITKPVNLQFLESVIERVAN